MRQMALYDFGVTDPPKVWDCMKTCTRADIFTDEFPLGRGKRCRYSDTQHDLNGWYSKTVDNLVTFYCKYYKVKEGDNE